MTRAPISKTAEHFRDAYRYRACGLDDIYLVNGYEVEDHDGERHVFVRDMEQLHEAIGRHLIRRRKVWAGAEIRFLRNTLALTQNELASELGRNAQSVARWEKGQVEIPGDAEKLMRIVLFAKLARPNELEELRNLILDNLPELDEIDEKHIASVSFEWDGHWTESVAIAGQQPMLSMG